MLGFYGAQRVGQRKMDQDPDIRSTASAERKRMIHRPGGVSNRRSGIAHTGEAESDSCSAKNRAYRRGLGPLHRWGNEPVGVGDYVCAQQLQRDLAFGNGSSDLLKGNLPPNSADNSVKRKISLTRSARFGSSGSSAPISRASESIWAFSNA